jgi:hypothetical protein
MENSALHNIHYLYKTSFPLDGIVNKQNIWFGLQNIHISAMRKEAVRESDCGLCLAIV